MKSKAGQTISNKTQQTTCTVKENNLGSLIDVIYCLIGLYLLGMKIKKNILI